MVLKKKVVRGTICHGDFYVKTTSDSYFHRCKDIIAVKLHWYSTKHMLFDSETGKKIDQLRFYDSELDQTFDMNIDKFHGWIRVHGYTDTNEEVIWN